MKRNQLRKYTSRARFCGYPFKKLEKEPWPNRLEDRRSPNWMERSSVLYKLASDDSITLVKLLPIFTLLGLRLDRSFRLFSSICKKRFHVIILYISTSGNKKWHFENLGKGPFIRVSQVAKSLKNYSSSPDSHYFDQACLKIAKNLKINAYLRVPHILQSLLYFRM